MTTPPGMARRPADRATPAGIAKFRQPTTGVKRPVLPEQANPKAISRDVMMRRARLS